MLRQISKSFTQRVSLIKGIVTGPELGNAVVEAFKVGDFPVEFNVIDSLDLNSETCRKKIKENKIIFAGNIGEIENHSAENLKLFQFLGLYGQIIHFKSLPNTDIFFKDIDTYIVRENLEGEYSTIEHEIKPGTFQSIKLITETGSNRIAKLAFDLARKMERKKITAIHKANIMKLVDGLFLNCTRNYSKDYNELEYNEMIIDNCAMQIIKNPKQFDVMVAPNLFGGIISSIFSGLIKGPGLEKGWYYGEDYQLFSQGLRVLGNKMIGKANPTGSLLSASLLLKQLGLEKESELLETAVFNVYKEGLYIQKSAGGKSTKKEFFQRILTEIKDLKKKNN